MKPQLNSAAPQVSTRSALSSLMDGQTATADLPAALAAWQREADARQAWHTYHLIGDVLRSDDLAAAPLCDEAFLQALRGRLAHEPVPLAPAPLLGSSRAPSTQPSDASRWRGWMAAPVAVAAGFAVVAAVLVVMRVAPNDPAAGAQLAQAGPAKLVIPVQGDVVRDLRLDRYLEAHRSLASGVVAAGAAEHRVQIVFEPK